jgi:hypothetical protein
MQIMIQVCATSMRATNSRPGACRSSALPLLSGGSTIDRLVVNLAAPTPVAQPYGSGGAAERRRLRRGATDLGTTVRHDRSLHAAHCRRVCCTHTGAACVSPDRDRGGARRQPAARLRDCPGKGPATLFKSIPVRWSSVQSLPPYSPLTSTRSRKLSSTRRY